MMFPIRRPLCALTATLLLSSACASNSAGDRAPRARLPTATMMPGPHPDLAHSSGDVDLTIEVRVDSAGRADITTLRVTGPGATQNWSAIARWIESARFRPAQHGGRAVPGVFRARIGTRTEVRRVG